MNKHVRQKHKTTPIKRRCHRCRGSGQAVCPICSGTGRVVSGKDVYGKPLFTRCEGCFGSRTRRCTVCHGEGFAI